MNLFLLVTLLSTTLAAKQWGVKIANNLHFPVRAKPLDDPNELGALCWVFDDFEQETIIYPGQIRTFKTQESDIEECAHAFDKFLWVDLVGKDYQSSFTLHHKEAGVETPTICVKGVISNCECEKTCSVMKFGQGKSVVHCHGYKAYEFVHDPIKNLYFALKFGRDVDHCFIDVEITIKNF